MGLNSISAIRKKEEEPPGIITFAQIPTGIRAVPAFPHAPMAQNH